MDGPLMIVVTGPPGTGKSTVAAGLGRQLGAAVLSWDWVMGGIAQTPEMVPVLRTLDVDRYVDVAWNVLTNLGIAHVRTGRSVVLDGVARTPQLDALREAASREQCGLLTVVTFCDDRVLHRTRVEGRRRDIPGWHELEWADVERFLAQWDAPDGDLLLDAAAPLAHNVGLVAEHLSRS